MNISLFFEEEINISMKIEELLSDNNIKNNDEIFENAFESRGENKILVITFLSYKKFQEKAFFGKFGKKWGVKKWKNKRNKAWIMKINILEVNYPKIKIKLNYKL